MGFGEMGFHVGVEGWLVGSVAGGVGAEQCRDELGLVGNLDG